MNVKISTIIIEDDVHAQNYLATLLEKNFNQIQILGCAGSIQKSVQLIEDVKPELVFMDIELRDGNSFEVFEKISYYDFEVIFVTAFNNFIQKAIEHYAFSFITKPIDDSKLIETVKRYINLHERLFSKKKYLLLSNFIEKCDSRFLLHIGNEHIPVKVNDIIKCEADGNYTKFYMNDGKEHLASNYLKYYEALLEHKGFFKAHRSMLINTRFISSIYKKETIILTNGDNIHVSIRNKSRLSELINTLS